jgi:hypothetical protein
MKMILRSWLWICCGAVCWSAESKNYSVTIGGKEFAVELPGVGWETQDYKTNPWLTNPPPDGAEVVAMFHAGDRSRYAMVLTIFPNADWPKITKETLSGMLSTWSANFRWRKPATAEQVTKIGAMREGGKWVVETRAPDGEHDSVIPAEFLGESKVHVSMMLLLFVDITKSGKMTESFVIASTTVFLLKDRLFFVSFYEPYADEKTYEDVKATTLDLAARIIEKNS